MTDWREDLDHFLEQHDMLTTEQQRKRAEAQARIRPFFDQVVMPALEDLKAGFEERDRSVEIVPSLAEPHDPIVEVIIRHGDDVELVFIARIEAKPDALRIRQEYDLGTGMTQSTSGDLTGSTRQKEEIIELIVHAWKQGIFLRQRKW